MMKFRRVLAVPLIASLAACSSGADPAADAPAADAQAESGTLNAGVPVNVDPLGVREIVHNTMAGKRVAYIPISNSGFELTAQWGVEIERTLSMLGAELTTYDPNFDTDKMVQIIDGLLADGNLDALVLHNPDVGVLTEQITTAQSKGIYVVVVNMISNQSGDAFIGSDVTSAAADLGERVVSDCKASGGNKVAIIDGWGPDGFSIGANAGWDPVFESAGFEVVSRQQGKYDPAEANTIATAVLQQNPDICAFVVNWDIMSLGAGEAVAAAGRTGEIGVYTLDASNTWCTALREGKATAAAAYNVDGIGVGAALALQNLFELGQPAGSMRTVSYVPHVIVDADNVDTVAGACYAGS